MAEEHRTPLPPGVELAWSTARERKPGPRAALDLATIVDTAVELADREGLASVSLARLAATLAVATTSLYRHVGSKEDLVFLMRDAATRPPAELPDPDPARWRESLAALARSIFERCRAHPWVLEVPSPGPPTAPGELLWGEHMLRAMSRTSLNTADQLRAITLIVGYVRDQARLALDPVINDAGAGEQDYAQLLGRVLRPDRYPLFCRAFTDPDLDTSIAYTDEDFRWGLEIILTGIDAMAHP